MALLRYLDEAGLLQSKLLDVEHFLIGRAATCQLVIDSDMISREHVRIDLESNGRFRVRDLGSRNRTFVNGEQITETMLTGGDILRAGDHVLEFVDESTKPEAPDTAFLTPDRTEPPDCEWIKLKAPFSLSAGQVEQLARLCTDQPLTARAEDIAQTVLGQLLLDLQADRGFIALKGSGKTDLVPLAQRALKCPPGGSLTPVSQSFLFAPLLQQVAGRYPQTAGQINAKLGFAATAVVAPITHRGDVIGVVYVDRPASKKPFATTALHQLAATGAAIGSLLAESSRKLTAGAVREGAAWLTTLRRVQAAVASTPAPSDTFDVVSKCLPGRVRCGDLATVVHVDEHRCALIVVDGGGHGITGLVQGQSILLAVRTALAASEDGLHDPAVVFNAINQLLAAAKGRQVLPCAFVGLDLNAGKLSYVNAGGMPPLLLVGPGRLVTLDQPSLVLGVDRDYVYATTRMDLPESFRVVCCTDGWVEASPGGGEAFGEQRLHELLLEREAFATAAALLAKMTSALTSHLAGSPPDDDAMALIVARG